MVVFHIVVNPAGASGRTIRIWDDLERIMIEEDADYTVHFSTRECGIEQICRNLTSDPAEGEDIRLVVLGGDGTLNEAVNGICDLSRVSLGYIPAGSSNDIARGLALKQDRENILRQILKGETVRSIDVGKVEFLDALDVSGDYETGGRIVRRFLSGCGIGFDAHICQQVSVSGWKKVLNKIHLGKLIYLAVAMKVIFTEEMIPFLVTVDGKTQELGKCLFTVAMNESYEGGGFRFCPDAKDDDGKLTMCSADHMSRFDFFRIFPYAYNGKHLKFRGISEYDGEIIRIRTAVPLWVHTDGEVICRSQDIQLSTEKTQLRMMM